MRAQKINLKLASKLKNQPYFQPHSTWYFECIFPPLFSVNCRSRTAALSTFKDDGNKSSIEGLGLVALNGVHFAPQPLCRRIGDSGLSRFSRPLSQRLQLQMGQWETGSGLYTSRIHCCAHPLGPWDTNPADDAQLRAGAGQGGLRAIWPCQPATHLYEPLSRTGKRKKNLLVVEWNLNPSVTKDVIWLQILYFKGLSCKLGVLLLDCYAD